MKDKSPNVLNSICQLHALLKLKKPSNPLVSVINVTEVDVQNLEITEPVIFNFYVVNFKKNCQGKVRYGQQYYDFDEGVLSFVALSLFMSE